MIARAVHGARVHDHSRKPAGDSLQNHGLGAMFAVGVREGCAERIEGGVLIGGPAIARDADRRDRGGVNHPRHARGQARLHHDPRALNVDPVNLFPLGSPIRRHRRDVEDEVAAGYRACDGFRLQDVTQDVLDRQPFQHDEFGSGSMQHAHSIATSDQCGNDLRADKTGAARDQDFHSGFSYTRYVLYTLPPRRSMV